MLTNIGYALLIAVPLLLLTVWMEKKTDKFQMGGGDLKLLFGIALFFTPIETLLIMFIGSVIQLISLKYTKAMMLPLAPALFISTICLTIKKLLIHRMIIMQQSSPKDTKIFYSDALF